MKKTPHQLRLDPDIDDEVKKIADVTGLPQIEIMRQMVTAGVKVIKANGYKLTLPLKLELAPDETPKNSSSSTLGLGGGVARKGTGDAQGEKKKLAS